MYQTWRRENGIRQFRKKISQLLAVEKMNREAAQEQYQQAIEDCQVKLSQQEYRTNTMNEKHGRVMQKKDVEIVNLVSRDACLL